MAYLFQMLVGMAFFVTLIRIEVNTKKKLDNDERMIERLDLIINDLRKSKSNTEV